MNAGANAITVLTAAKKNFNRNYDFRNIKIRGASLVNGIFE